MASGWRASARLITLALAAAAASRATESARRLLADVTDPPELSGPLSRPATLGPSGQSRRLTAAHIHAPAHRDHALMAQAESPHEFGPIPVISPSHGIGFRSEPQLVPTLAEMPVISLPPSREPDGPEHEGVPPARAVVVPESVRTAASIVQDLDEDPEIDDDELADDDDEGVPADVHDQPAAETERAIAARPEPLQTLRLTAPPVEDTVIDPEDEAPVVASPQLRETVAAPVKAPLEPATPAVDSVPAPRSEKAMKKRPTKDQRRDPKEGKHRRRSSAVSGAVRSSRGRGLRGMQVTVLDDRHQIIGTAVTGRGGEFVVDELPAGSYRIAAGDEADGDFGPGWHAGTSFDRAPAVKVKQGRTRRKADVVLVSASAVELDVDVRKKKAVVGITVTERATGLPADGSVRVSTRLFSAELALVEGRATMTLIGSAKGSTKGAPVLSKKVTVDYLGTRHTEAGAATAKLRR